MSDSPTFQIPKEIIDPIIKAHVNEAVIKALDGPQRLVSNAILSVIQTQVDRDGKPTTWNGTPWIDYVIADCIREAARDAIKEFLATQRERIKADMAAQLSRKNSPLIKQLCEGLVGSITSESTLKYRLNIAFDKDRD